jgi:GntR family transcriptional regulator / MocR family aminotransferase
MRKWGLLTAALDPADRRPLYLQLSNAIAEDIRKGRLKPGDPLPGTRVLCQQLRIHRNTVIAGYQELVAQGLASTRRGGGTFVAMPTVLPLASSPHAGARERPPTYDVPSPIRPVPMTPPDPGGPLSLVRAIPDVRLLPAEALSQAFRRAIFRHGRKLLGYGDPRGHPLLRQGLATMLSHARGIPTSRDDIVVTRGSQQALYLIAQALLSPGDVIAVEDLGNPLVWRALRLPGTELEPVPVDENGLDVSALEALLARRKLRAVYVTPHHQFPTNAVMSAERRRKLASLARKHRFAIIEDDYDHEFQYEGQPAAPIAAGPGAENVLYVGTLSKVLAPGLRVGFVLAPPEVRERLVSLRTVNDMQGDTAVECAVAELFEDGELVRHVRRMGQIYARRRDALAEALQGSLRDVLSFRVPEGGMALWTRVAEGIDIPAWERACEALGVLVRGAGMFDFAERPRPYLRLGFTYHDESELREAVTRMARGLGEVRKVRRVR